MKLNIYLIGAFFGMLILASSCSNEDDNEISVSKDKWYWGYFKGTINGEEISLENLWDDDLPVRTVSKHIISYYPSEENKLDSLRKIKTVIGISTGITYSENKAIRINLFNLYKGIRFVTNSTKVDFIYDGIQITQDTHSYEYENRYIRYIPKKETPFKVEITNITYADDTNTNPIIEADLNGVLYRSDNPKDSIVVKGSYGTR